MSAQRKQNGKMKQAVSRAAVRAFWYHLILEVLLWLIVAVAVSKHHIVAILHYPTLLQLILMFLLGILGITVVIFVVGILMESRRKEESL